MRHSLVFGTALAIALNAVIGAADTAMAHMPGYGMMGPGYGHHGMMCGHGAGMMGPGYGHHGMMHGHGPGMMGQGMMGRGMMGQGMMGPGMMGPEQGPGMMQGPGYGMRGGAWLGGSRDHSISTDDAKNYFERWIAFQGNPRLKVGDVKEKDADTLTVDIVTKEGSVLVQRFVVNRRNGFYRPEEG
jgi:hypothetical protein